MSTKKKQTSSNAHNLKLLEASCKVNEVMKIICPRWKMQILDCISKGEYQFGTLKNIFPTISDQVLAVRIKELVKEGLIIKTTVADKFPKQIKYAATARAKLLLPIIMKLYRWGEEQL